MARTETSNLQLSVDPQSNLQPCSWPRVPEELFKRQLGYEQDVLHVIWIFSSLTSAVTPTRPFFLASVLLPLLAV